MIPAGYLAKRISSRPEWLKATGVVDIYSLSEHVSPAFADYVPYWRHNGFWLFDSPEIIRQVAAENAIDLAGQTFFYYEVLEQQFDQNAGRWLPFEPAPLAMNPVVPSARQLAGYDVVTFYAGAGPECSPLSCNGLAHRLATNAHCLLESLDEARKLLEQGAFRHSGPGPYRIFSVSTLTDYSFAPWRQSVRNIPALLPCKADNTIHETLKKK